MKKLGKIFWLGILALIVLAGIVVAVQTIQENAFATKMEGLDVSSAKGSLVAGYDIAEDKYTTQYIPKELLAKKQSDVGYLLKVSYSKTGASYTGGHYVSGTAIEAQLVDCDTGEVIAERIFEPYFPMQVSEKVKTVSVDSDVVIKWVTHVYPEWPADKDVGHEWKDATCTQAKTCDYCGITEGEPAGHVFGPDGCTVCGELSQCQKEGHQVNWVMDKDDITVMTGTCNVCGEALTEAADWEKAGASLIIGRWKGVQYRVPMTFDRESLQEDIYVQINADGTGAVEYENHTDTFTWTFRDADEDPDYFKIQFNIQLENDSHTRTIVYDYDNILTLNLYEGTYYFEKTLDTASMEHKIDKWTLNEKNVSLMMGTCSDCGETLTTDTDWFLFVDTMPVGSWKIETVMDRETYNTVSHSKDIHLIINDDHTALLHTPEKDYSFTWRYSKAYTDEYAPDYYSVYYDFVDDTGAVYSFAYDNFDSISIFNDEVGAFFVR